MEKTCCCCTCAPCSRRPWGRQCQRTSLHSSFPRPTPLSSDAATVLLRPQRPAGRFKTRSPVLRDGTQLYPHTVRGAFDVHVTLSIRSRSFAARVQFRLSFLSSLDFFDAAKLFFIRKYSFNLLF